MSNIKPDPTNFTNKLSLELNGFDLLQDKLELIQNKTYKIILIAMEEDDQEDKT